MAKKILFSIAKRKAEESDSGVQILFPYRSLFGFENIPDVDEEDDDVESESMDFRGKMKRPVFFTR